MTNLDALRARRETLKKGISQDKSPRIKLRGTEDHQKRQGELHVADFARAGATAAGDVRHCEASYSSPNQPSQPRDWRAVKGEE